MLVIDASVAVKWAVPEPGADRAILLRERQEEFIAPTLIAAEIGSAMRKHVRYNNLSPVEALHGARVAVGLIDRMIPIPELAYRALELSLALNHPIYDCFYVALAERERAALMTADERLIRAAKRAKGIEVRAL